MEMDLETVRTTDRERFDDVADVLNDYEIAYLLNLRGRDYAHDDQLQGYLRYADGDVVHLGGTR